MGIVASIIVAALLGALSFGYKSVREGAMGAALGLLGGSVILGSLRLCTFAADAASTEAVLGIGLAGAFAWMFGAGTRAVLGQRSADLGSGENRSGTYKLGWYWPWLLLSPTLLILILFLYLPAFQTFTLSTKLANLTSPRTADRCLSNFSDLMVESPTRIAMLPLVAIAMIWGVALWSKRSTPGTRSHSIAKTLQPMGILAVVFAFYFMFETESGTGGYRLIYLNTIIISLSIVALAMTVGLAMAYLAFGRIRGITVYRTLLIWPYAISPPVAGILFFMMFNATAGIFAFLADKIGIEFPNYTASAGMARGVIVLASVWKLLGYNLLFFLAGLQTVPRAQIEAATLDGANAWQRFRLIVMPALGPIAFFLLVTNLTYSFFEVYGTVDLLTKGAPASSTSVAIYEIIRVGVNNQNIGKGAAQSVLLFLAVIGLTAWQFRQSEGRVSYAGS